MASIQKQLNRPNIKSTIVYLCHPRSNKRNQIWIQSRSLSSCHIFHCEYKQIQIQTDTAQAYIKTWVYFMLQPIQGPYGAQCNVPFVTRLHTPHKAWAQLGEKRKDKKEKKNSLYNMCIHRHANKTKKENSIKDWFQIAESCHHSKPRTRSRISSWMGIISSRGIFHKCPLWFPCFVLLLFRRKSQGLSWCL